jgi:WD40 repeat protein/transcriptional regulator with XRE-family HTH domain
MLCGGGTPIVACVAAEEGLAVTQHYHARDHAFGTRLLALRSRASLSQQEVATRLGVSERAVRAWEAGASYPDPTNLQGLLATYLKQGAFPVGQEEAEARALWEQARHHSPRFKLPFDPTWFANLLATRTPRPAPSSANSREEKNGNYRPDGKEAAAHDAAARASEAPVSPAPATVAERGAPTVPAAATARQDWGEAPDVSSFHGRAQELATLTSWTLADHCRVVALLGLGGIGKTALAARLAQNLADQFACVFWRSLRNALPFDEWLRAAAGFLSDQQQTTLPEGQDARLGRLLDLLRERRCLLVLDNWETVLAPGAPELGYRAGYEGYGVLLRRLGEARHRSLLLLTSREQPPELAPLEGAQAAVRVLGLGGLGEAESQALLQDQGLSGESASWGVLVERYGGNPLALRLVGATIAEVFGGDISAFLAEGATVTGGIRRLLEEQVGRLSPPEQTLLTWLAIEREPIGFGELVADLLSPLLFHPANGPVWGLGVARAQVMEAVEALRHRSLLEPVVAASFPAASVRGARGSFTLQPVVLEYLTDRLVQAVAAEIAQTQPALLVSHALLKATARDYVRHSQERLIAQPLLERLRATSDVGTVERQLLKLLEAWRGRPAEEQGYGPGNAVNLLRLLRDDLRALDLSRLAIRQAYLADVEAQDASLAGAHLAAVVLAEVFVYPTAVALSVDGAFLAAGTPTGEVRLWHAGDRTPLLTVLGHTGGVYGLAFSGDERLLASGGTDGTVRLWEVASGRPLATIEGHVGTVWGVAVSGDGRLLASGGADGTVRLWEAPSGRLLATLQGHAGAVWGVALAGDGHLVASGGADGTVRLWEATPRYAKAPAGDITSATAWASGYRARLLETLQGHAGVVRSVALTGDGRLLASGSFDGTVRLWEAEGRQLLATMQGHVGAVWGVALAGDGQLAASASADGTVRLWEVASGRPLATLQGHTGAVWHVALSGDGRLAASGGVDGTVRLWEPPSGRLLATLQGLVDAVRGVALSWDGRLLASGGVDGTVRLWEAGSGRLLVTLQGHTGVVRGVTFSRDGQLMASGSWDGTVRLWEATPASGYPGRALATLRGHTDGVYGVALSGDGRRLASGGIDGTVRLWDVPSGRPLATLQGHAGAVWEVALSEDGQVVASGSADGTVRLWEAPSGRSLATIEGHAGAVWGVALSGDGHLVASGGADGTVRLWEAPSGRSLAAIEGHVGAVWGVALSGDGHLVASGGIDGTVKLWEAPSGRALATPQGHIGVVRGVALSGDGHLLACGDDDGAVRLWEAGSGACLRVLRAERRYERMDITGLTGVTEAQRSALLALGAVERGT